MTFTMLGASFAGALIDAGSAASAAGGPEGGQGFNPLEVSPGLAVWSGVTFLILLFLLTKFAWKPIVAAVEAREHKLEGDLAGAEKARADAEAAARKLAAELDAAALKARETVEQARASAERVAAEIAARAKAEAEAARARAEADIEAAREKALADIKEVAVDLAIAITREVVKKSASDDDHRKAAEEVVKAMTAKSKKGVA
jgi:F-type H+-transporting ATPase subunit b